MIRKFVCTIVLVLGLLAPLALMGTSSSVAVASAIHADPRFHLLALRVEPWRSSLTIRMTAPSLHEIRPGELVRLTLYASFTGIRAPTRVRVHYRVTAGGKLIELGGGSFTMTRNGIRWFYGTLQAPTHGGPSMYRIAGSVQLGSRVQRRVVFLRTA